MKADVSPSVSRNEWSKFQERHSVFLSRLDNLTVAFKGDTSRSGNLCTLTKVFDRWGFHALASNLPITRDFPALQKLLPVCRSIAQNPIGAN